MLAAASSCSRERPPPAPADASRAREVPPDPPPKEADAPHRANLGHSRRLYLPTWLSSRGGTYDLVVHFHGMGSLQEKNVERVRLDAAVVSVNLGAGTEVYGAAFRDPQAFDRLLESAEAEIASTDRVPGAKIGRIALTAWSAGFLSVAKILASSPSASRVDAILLADGFFTSFKDVKKRAVNEAALTPFVAIVEQASRGERLFALTHSSIPTQGYPSVEETVGKLLEMAAIPKIPSDQTGPGEMRTTYEVDRGDFHVKGYRGVTAKDHVAHIKSMGETMYPYLKARWTKPAADAATPPHSSAP